MPLIKPPLKEDQDPHECSNFGEAQELDLNLAQAIGLSDHGSTPEMREGATKLLVDFYANCDLCGCEARKKCMAIFTKESDTSK